MIALDPFFPCITAPVGDPFRVSREAIVAEFDRDIDWREKSLRKRVGRNGLTAEAAAREIALFTAIRDDFQCDLHLDDEDDGLWQKLCETAKSSLEAFSWTDIVDGLRTEILLRRQWYPRMVADNRIDQKEADRQLRRIEAAHLHYWFGMRRYWPSELDAKRYRPKSLTVDERQLFLKLWTAHRARFEASAENRSGHYAEAPEPRMAWYAA